MFVVRHFFNFVKKVKSVYEPKWPIRPVPICFFLVARRLICDVLETLFFSELFLVSFLRSKIYMLFYQHPDICQVKHFYSQTK